MKKHDWFVLAGIALWIIETWYFGWNEKAQTVQEKLFDGVAFYLILYGVLLGIGASIKTEVHVHNHGTQRQRVSGDIDTTTKERLSKINHP